MGTSPTTRKAIMDITWDILFPWCVKKDDTFIYGGDTKEECHNFLLTLENPRKEDSSYEIMENSLFDKDKREYYEAVFSNAFLNTGDVIRRKKKLRVFISQPMHGLKEEDYLRKRQTAIKYLRNKYGNIEVVDNYHHENAPENAGRLWYLGQSISLLDKIDAVYFTEDISASNKGCIAEWHICDIYNIPILE